MIKDRITKIGDDFLLNIPKVIGNQLSFYDDGNRTHKIFSRRAKVYEHEIRFIIPEGYSVNGTENLEFEYNYSTTIKGKVFQVSSFVSTAEIKENVLIIQVNEFYEEGLFPKSEIKDYRSVVNAAYEFYISEIKLLKN